MASTLDKPCVASEQDRVALVSLVGVGLGTKRIERLLNYVVELCYPFRSEKINIGRVLVF